MKRWTIRTLVSLLLGAVTTVAVAWSFAWLNRVHYYGETTQGLTTYGSEGWYLKVFDELGSRVILGTSFEWLASNAKWEWQNDFLPHGSIGRIPDCYLSDPQGNHFISRQERGFPFRAMALEAVEFNGPGWDPPKIINWGIQISELRKGNNEYTPPEDDNYVALPLKPMPLGFVLDTFVYGCFWLFVLLLRSLAIRKRLFLSVRLCIFVTSILILLGVLSTIGVSWICALCVYEMYVDTGHGDSVGTDSYPDTSLLARWRLRRYQEPGAMRLSSSLYAMGTDNGFPVNANTNDICPSWVDFAKPPKEWLEIDKDGNYIYNPHWNSPEGQEIDNWWRRLDARGWPMLAMWSGMKPLEDTAEDEPQDADLYIEVVNGILIKKYDEDEFRDDWSRLIPLAPIWFGFAVDTLFYACFWSWFAVFIFGPKISLRTWRKHRGKCPMCGYDLRIDFESGCPECGWNRE